jgi:ATP-dependent Clp protease ATP-binding subunit ClpA
VIAKVVEKFVFQLEAQLADRNVTIELTPPATEWLMEHGYEEAFGARPMARVIQEYIKKPLAEELLFGRLEHGGTVRVSVEEKDGKKSLAFEVIEARTKPLPPANGDEDAEADSIGEPKLLVSEPPLQLEDKSTAAQKREPKAPKTPPKGRK